ncbi:MAG: hypothetical protein ACR2NZ_23070 [Rubripirellula sp.]
MKLLFFVPMFITASVAFAAEKPPVPDFVTGAQIADDAAHDWNLGLTGARGWVYSYRCESTDARQILVTEVEQGSPADGEAQWHTLLRCQDHKIASGDS